jgi:hypothetical protein
MGGWYVCIIDMGRDERPVSERWRCCWAGEGEARSLLYSFSAVALSANEWEVGGFEGDCGAVGEGAADEAVVFVLGCWVEPPHCDMNERTVHERTERSISEVLSYAVLNGAGCLAQQHGRGMLGAAIYLSWGEPSWTLFPQGARKLLLATQHQEHQRHQEAQAMPSTRGCCYWVSRASHGCTGSK